MSSNTGDEVISRYVDVKVGESSKVRGFAEIRFNPHLPRDMQVDLHFDGFESSIQEGLRSDSAPIVLEGVGLKVELHESAGWSHDFAGAHRLSAGVKSLSQFVGWTNDEITKAHFGYNFPLVGALDSFRTSVNKHYRRGYYRTKGFEDDGSTPEVLKIEHEGVEISFGDRLDFYDHKDERYPESRIVRGSGVEFKLSVENDDLEGAVDKARGIVDSFLMLVSAVERDRIRWTSESVFGRTEGGDPAYRRSVHRWASPPRAGRSKEHSNKPIETLEVLVKSYSDLDATHCDILHKTLSEFEIAHTAKTIETQLIYWHSILDFLRSRLGFGGHNVSRRLVALCDQEGVPLDDIAPEQVIQDIRDKKRAVFGFTELRNTFIHDGFDVFEGRYDEVLKEIGRARALAERIILDYIGIDYTLTSLGDPRPY